LGRRIRPVGEESLRGKSPSSLEGDHYEMILWGNAVLALEGHGGERRERESDRKPAEGPPDGAGEGCSCRTFLYGTDRLLWKGVGLTSFTSGMRTVTT
jgi:hypothetical protein